MRFFFDFSLASGGQFSLILNMSLPTIRLLVLLFVLSTPLAKASIHDTTKILYIGNSFTYFNNLPSMVDSLAQRDHQPIWHYMHAPGGISVGDTGVAAAAHMDNPLVYQLIRNTDWDFVVVQDNQGRFILDSAVFPSKSRVLAGHRMLMDSVKHYHPCAKMIWFAGWGLKNGQLPNWPTGVSMIDKLLVNYRVLNATAKEIIAPIGEAWKKSIGQTTLDLWISDEMHPSVEGSYLTALVLYSTIFHTSVLNNGYTAGITALNAFSLQNIVNNLLSTAAIIKQYNLNGVQLPPIYSTTQLHAPINYAHYQWYLAGNKIVNATDSVFTPTTSGTYWVTFEDGTGCILKSCYTEIVLATQLNENTLNYNAPRVFPNPFNSILHITGSTISKLQLMDITGKPLLDISDNEGNTTLDLSFLSDGLYLLKIISPTAIQLFQLFKQH